MPKYTSSFNEDRNDPDPAVSVFFSVSVDGYELGDFSSCEGLGFEVVVEQREEGGNNDFVHQLPGRIKYSNVKLGRPLDKQSAEVAKWFATMHGKVSRTIVHITAKSPAGSTVASWALHGAIPVKWQGPGLNVDTAKVSMETIEFAHHGFLPL